MSKVPSEFLYDDALLLASGIKHLGDSVWGVNVFTPQLQMATVSCILPAVNLCHPTRQSDALRDLQVAVNEHSQRILLRVDYGDVGEIYQLEMVTVLVADVLFLPEQRGPVNRLPQWASLQETLVRLGLGYICRPTPFRWKELRTIAETAPRPEGFDAFNEKASCTVVDVARGDTFVVEWDAASQQRRLDSGRDPYPPVLVLRMTPCERYREETVGLTRSGFEALRWSRERLIGQKLDVQVHTVLPSERDLACNNYAVSLDRRGAVEGLARDAEGLDISSQMLERGLVKVREAPFPLHIHCFHLYSRIVQIHADSEMNSKPGEWTEDRVRKSLQESSKLQPNQLETLMLFLGSAWWESCCQSRTATVDRPSWTRHLLHRFVFASNYKDSSAQKHLCIFHPLRTIMAMNKVAQMAPPFKGSVKQILYHENVETTGERHNYLQMDLEIFATEQRWEGYFVQSQVERLSYIAWSPDPEDLQPHKEIQVSVQYTGTEKVRLSVRSLTCPRGTDTAALDLDEGRQEINHRYYDFERVSAKAGEDQVLVCDVKVFLVDTGETEHRRVVYKLSATAPAAVDDEDGSDPKAPLKQAMPDADNKSEDGEAIDDVVEESRTFISAIPFFFRVDAPLESLKGSLPALQKELLARVVCLPIALARVNGILGFLGDLFLQEERHPSFCSFGSHELNDLDEAPFSFLDYAANKWGPLDSLMHSIQMACNIRRDHLLRTGEVTLQDTPARLRICAGEKDQLWVDAAHPAYTPPKISPTIFPSRLRLVALSLMSRMLVPENPANSLVGVSTGKAQKKGQYERHPDFAMWTDIRVPLMPNIYTGHFDQLPHALRNVERRYCRNLLRQRADGLGPDQLHAAADPLTTVMTLLFHLRLVSMRHQSMHDRYVIDDLTVLREAMPTRLHNPDKLRSAYSTRAMLYRIPLHGTPETCQGRWGLFLGSRASYQSDFMEIPLSTTHASDLVQLVPKIFRRASRSLIFETICHTPEARRESDPLEESIHVITQIGERQTSGVTDYGYLRRSKSMPVLYHPLEWLHVLGRPLMEREEEDDGAAEEVVVHRFQVSYRIPFYQKNLYKSESYGRLSKTVLREYQQRLWQRLQPVRDWCGLLLSRAAPYAADSPASVAATGVLYFFGTATEPISALFMTKKQLRVSECIPRNFDPPRSDPEQEAKDLRDLAEPVREIMNEINKAYAHVPSTRLVLSLQSLYPLESAPYMSIKVRHVEEKTPYEPVVDMTNEWAIYETLAAEPAVDGLQNPHRPFSETVDAAETTESELRVTYNLEFHKFEFEWVSKEVFAALANTAM